MNEKKELVFISGPISGVENYEVRFKDAQHYLENNGYAVVNPAIIVANYPDNIPKELFQAVELKLLGACDRIYMLNEWNKSCGCNREYGYALAKGLTIMFETGVYKTYDIPRMNVPM